MALYKCCYYYYYYYKSLGLQQQFKEGLRVGLYVTDVTAVISLHYDYNIFIFILMLLVIIMMVTVISI